MNGIIVLKDVHMDLDMTRHAIYLKKKEERINTTVRTCSIA
jgi:hypothetical protein